ncbi:UPF0075 domain protein [Melanomma pulvis-pyrius CBS 109.77]|uniref:UPF0075 domain protein n=1 Tax=Melanomma pulvis-pyrius CBS 109.77 TaxID=1314802 RepID=A0A6A6WTM5_9PLEO|nr:UPF0075 domain protein [Melanomma pulvis-pyrius CBS 109.77]
MSSPNAAQKNSPPTTQANDGCVYGLDKYGSLYRVAGHAPNGALDLKVLGVNCGASRGRIDCALAHIRQESGGSLHINLLLHDHIPISPSAQASILRMARETPTNLSTSRINVTLGHIISAAVKTICKNHIIPIDSIDLIGSCAPTAWLYAKPENDEISPEGYDSGEKVIATETGITTVADLRLADQSIGIHGAPPVVQLRHFSKFRAYQHISAVANLCFIPPDCDDGGDDKANWIPGLGTMLIDTAIRYYTVGKLKHDHGGKWGARGAINQYVVDQFIRNSEYIKQLNSESMGREALADKECQALREECLFLAMSEYDTIATITRITAQHIVQQYRTNIQKHLATDRKVDEIFVCGDGVRNPNIMSYLQSELGETSSIQVLHGVVSDCSEDATSMAKLAVEAVIACVGAPKIPESSQLRTSNGKIGPGRRWDELVEQVTVFRQGVHGNVDKTLYEKQAGSTWQDVLPARPTQSERE